MANDNLAAAITKGSNGAVRLPDPPANLSGGVMSNLGEAYKLAKVFANSQLVPKHLQGKPDDCFIALLMAEQLRCNATMVMQNIVIVQGTAGWRASFVIARANELGPFDGPIEFRTEGKGESLAVTAYATVAKTKRVVERTVSMAMAKAAGWTSNKKYQEIPEQMLSYRAACFLVRLYCPEVLLGMQSEDELVDIRASRGGPVPSEMIESSARAIDVLNADAPAALPTPSVHTAPTPDEIAELERLSNS